MSGPQMSIVSNDDLEIKIGIVMRQTNYNKDHAQSSLEKNNYDTEKCIKEYLGVPDKKEKQVSVNQQIYRELRKQLGSVDPSVIQTMQKK